MMLVAADRNPYAERAVLLGPDGRPLSHFAGTSQQTCDRWLEKVMNQNPGVPIVASTLDRWPATLLEHPDIRWLHPGLVKRLYSACLPWNLRRKLHRARLFAYLHKHRVSSIDVDDAVKDFELQTAYQILDEIV
ncbi:hypothetical protein IV102_36305 [bacterium]|nr:hypothetical protein [bacterium]